MPKLFAFHNFPAVTPLADRAQKLPLGGWLNEGRLAVILQRKLPIRNRPQSGRRSVRLRLRDVLASGTTRISYTYDFGDSWEHSLTVSDIRAGAPGTAYPRFIAGERDCPPEDCGGIPGFYEMLEARVDPEHPDHAEMAEWLDGYDPEELDVFPIEVALGRIAARRNAAAKRIVKPANG